MRTLGKYMLGSGATFGYVGLNRFLSSSGTLNFVPRKTANHCFAIYSLFMSIGSVIRTEGPHNDAWLRARGPPMMLPRQDPFRPTRE